MTPLKPLRLTGNRSYLKCIGHQTPASTPPIPLSLQDEEGALFVLPRFGWQSSLGMKLPRGNTTTPATLTTPTTLAIIPCNRFQGRCHGKAILDGSLNV